MVFDEDGQAHDWYEFGDDRRLTKADLAAAAEVRKARAHTRHTRGPDYEG